MPEEIEKILELAQPPVAPSPRELTVSKSARVSRVCGLLALVSVICFWLMMGLCWLAEEAGGDAETLVVFGLLAEGCLLPGLSLAAGIAAIVGFAGAKESPGNSKVGGWAVALTVLAVAGFIAPILVILSLTAIHFW
jgi:hypothetical protein